MNKLAIALAADSALSLGNKIFQSANKIFMLSSRFPVGIMIYGSTEFMGIPWETIIKLYRNQLGDQEKNRITDYLKDFLSFLDTIKMQYKAEMVANFTPLFSVFIQNIFNSILLQIQESTEQLRKKGLLTEEKITEIVNQQINQFYILYSNENIPNFMQNFPENLKYDQKIIPKLIEENKTLINKIRNDAFKNFQIDSPNLDHLVDLCLLLLTKQTNFYSNVDTGIVITGFGKEEIFPCMDSLILNFIYDNQILYRNYFQSKISKEVSVSITPFAQGDMVVGFMDGVSPLYRNFVNSFLSTFLKTLPRFIVEAIPKLSDIEKQEILPGISDWAWNFFNLFKNREEEIIASNSIPVIMAVNALPKEELATMAETLVNLTSFRKKMSMLSENVGGPIDVAIISKVDGFVWIKRKHYFKAELNPHFFKK